MDLDLCGTHVPVIAGTEKRIGEESVIPIEIVFKEDTPDYVYHLYDPQHVKLPIKNREPSGSTAQRSLCWALKKASCTRDVCSSGAAQLLQKWGLEIVLDGHRVLFVSDFADPLNNPNDFKTCTRSMCFWLMSCIESLRVHWP